MQQLQKGNWGWVYVYKNHGMPGFHPLHTSLDTELQFTDRVVVLSDRMVLYLTANGLPYCIYIHESLVTR